MEYCILNELKTITNIIVSDDENFVKETNAKPSYRGASIGSVYQFPPSPPTQLDLIQAQVTYTALKTNTLIGGSENEG